MANRVNTPMNQMQLAPSQPALDRAPCQAELLKLPAPYDTVLSLSQPRDSPVNESASRLPLSALDFAAAIRPPLTISGMVKGGRVRHVADAGGARRARGARSDTKGNTKRLQPAGTASGFDPLK